MIAASAREQAAAVREGRIGAVELAEAALAAIERVNGRLNAWVTLAPERALADAGAVRAGDPRPLAGVPIAVKDLSALTAGIRTTMGSAALGDWTPARDSATVRRLRAAGAVIVGKTNTSELGLLALTEPERFGPTRNPWDLERSTGGSSGGSAAAVAAETVALAHGSDGGSSVRVPASCCGLVGLKPSRGRVSGAPGTGDALGLSTEGPLAHSVGDVALGLEVMAGAEPGDPWAALPPSEPFDAAWRHDPRRLRVAVDVRAPTGGPVDPACAAVARGAADLLADLGHDVVEADPPWAGPEGMDRFMAYWTAGVAPAVAELGGLLGHPLDLERLEPVTRALVVAGRDRPALEYVGDLTWLRGYARRVLAAWTWDVLVTPALAAPPPVIGSLAPAPGEDPARIFWNVADLVPFTPIWNVTGQPALSLPLGESDSGLPLGVQLVGAPSCEDVLLALGGQLERAAPWAARRPPVVA